MDRVNAVLYFPPPPHSSTFLRFDSGETAFLLPLSSTRATRNPGCHRSSNRIPRFSRFAKLDGAVPRSLLSLRAHFLPVCPSESLFGNKRAQRAAPLVSFPMPEVENGSGSLGLSVSSRTNRPSAFHG